MLLRPIEIKELPKALPLRKLLGPSFILLGLGLGSGEVILWPYLTSLYGLGIIWGALVGITFQFFMNMEIERYALARGESVFAGFARVFKGSSIWYLFSTFFPWIWPGIAASSASLMASLFGFSNPSLLTIIFLISMGLILTLGPVLYKTLERFQMLLIGVGVPTIFALAIYMAQPTDWTALGNGILGYGDGFRFLPEGIVIATFLGAFAYSGAGGNLNLAQSFYIKEKGYGMGKYAGRITSILTGKKEDVTVSGSTFANTPENIKEFKKWWRNINIEHFLVFWVTGVVTIMLLALLSYMTAYGKVNSTGGVGFVLLEGAEIGKVLSPIFGTLFIFIAGATLFGTQLTVYDATSRILSENMILTFQNKFSERNIPKIYYTVLWLQILAGIIVILMGFTEPIQLLVLAAVLNAAAMFVHCGMTLLLNLKTMYKEIRPSYLRISVLLLALVFYGGFSIYNLYLNLIK